MAILNKQSEYWAYDLSKDIVSKGEIVDEACIRQSLELILSTFFGERLFNPEYGSSLGRTLFENMSNAKGEKLIEEILSSIERYEDRILVDTQNVEFKFYSSTNVLEINLPYVIIKQKIVSFFSKKISI